MKVNIFWFRRDLRLEDNCALNAALSSDLPVLPVFIFDINITDDLSADDARVTFIHKILSSINATLRRSGGSLYVQKGKPGEIWEKIVSTFDIDTVFVNKDYEPYSINRDNAVQKILDRKGIRFMKFKDQVIFEENEISKPDGTPYTVFTPYRNRWLKMFDKAISDKPDITYEKGKNFFRYDSPFPSLNQTGFSESSMTVRPYDLSVIPDYHKYRDLPSADRTSYLSPHLRFGTVSIRKLVRIAMDQNLVFLNELIWREFFMQILFNFPGVVTDNFKRQYDGLIWRNNEEEFLKWCRGETGYPIVDAGMRQLNTSGYMHNRIRMITAGFLCKHLLIDWRWGEAYFAGKLLDYEMSSNNGNWQWAAGTGCDAAPYFRIFNPETQQKKFDRDNQYIKKWGIDPGRAGYPSQVVSHEFARQRALDAYRKSIKW
jgi:deoxyribodipyrimidine photo-lyase